MRILILTFVFVLCSISMVAQTVSFTKESFIDEQTTLPYRKASFPGDSEKAALIIYLHGGSSKGNDNETQMQEPAIGKIAAWLSNKHRKAIMIVPQCPKDKSWIGGMLTTVKMLLQTFIDRDVADPSSVYILGGSMGGTGTWNMLSTYPGFFAAAMPVAGNPSGLDAMKVSKTPVYTVMGTKDVIMKIENVENFLADMDLYGADYHFDIEDGWTHEDTCKKSYTDERLEWVFSHHADSTETAITATEQSNEQMVENIWFDTGGRKLSNEPCVNGIYLKYSKANNGHVSVQKILVNKLR